MAVPTRGKRKEGKTKREKRRTHWELRTPAADTRHAFDGAGLPGPMCESGESTPPGAKLLTSPGRGRGACRDPGAASPHALHLGTGSTTVADT